MYVSCFMDTQCTFLQYYKCHKMSLNNYNVLLVLIFSAIKKKISLNGGGGGGRYVTITPLSNTSKWGDMTPQYTFIGQFVI